MTPANAVDDTHGPAAQAVVELDVLHRPDDQAALLVQTFFGVSSHSVPPERLQWVSQALADTDAAALHAMTYSYAPFFCPECAASYCGAQWNWREFDDDPFSGIEGDCPHGHFHILSY
ncbi:hypothetical protein [Mycobacterium asiaticum]|uniref:hypothetical protein n=1 Tax=Mycobacterium asiaticum TaxID=1790 RepID=UPI0012DB30EA|nr:hypothetical protein [Mycobacterium asiaticum]